MVSVKRMVLDVLKPHQPNALEFSKAVAEVGDDYEVHLTVLAMDEATETTQIVIESTSIDFKLIQDCISELGGSLHSIDEVLVHNKPGHD
jgi:hypothetical protein